MPSETSWHYVDASGQGKRKGSLQEPHGRATGLLIHSVKSNKELLLTEAIRPRRIRRNRLGGHSKKIGGNMGKTISFVKGKGSISHNNRDFIAGNVDGDRMAWNEYYVRLPIREAYQQIFGPAIAEYNAKQKRKDRQVTDYLTDIKKSRNKEKQFYEIVVQIGRMEDTGVLDANGELSVAARDAKEILDEYAKSFQERNPNLYLFNAVLHIDEATPHLHLDYIPVAHGYKTKMHTRNSLAKHCKKWESSRR